MQRERRRATGALGLVLPLTLAAACATEAQQQKPAPVVKERPPEVDPHALCAVIAEIEDARAKGTLRELRSTLDERALRNPKDRVAFFADSFAIEDEENRWKQFKNDGKEHPQSALGPLGECFVYAVWKMDDKAAAPCADADKKLKSLALVDVARGELALNKGDVEGARARFDAAVATDGACVPALARKASLEGSADAAAAVATWDRALAAWPQCFACATQKAELVEKSQGAQAAVLAWEAALAIAPEHTTTLKRYAAAQAGRDDPAALAAYEKALALGVKDPATMLAAARLAEQLGDVKKAVGHAKSATGVQPDDAETWRYLAALSTSAGDAEGADAAQEEVLRLLPDDGQAHLALALSAKKKESWVGALNHLERAAAALGSDAEHAAAKAESDKELNALLDKLMVRRAGAQGNVNKVVAVVQGDVRKVYEERRKHKRGLAGMVEVIVVTNEDGEVQEVDIKKDDLGDQEVAASLVGNLRRAKIVGGAKRYSFELDFQ